MKAPDRVARAWDAGIDWPAEGERALDLLRTYVRFPTINDPLGQDGATTPGKGPEQEAAGWLAEQLRVERVDCELLEAAPGRISLVAEIPASAPGAHRSAPITLLSHSDVVPAIASEWDVDPYAAAIRGGFLYGRGVLDLKSLGIAQMTALILLRRQEIPLTRGVRLIVAADEECGGTFGAKWLLAARPSLLDTSLVLGEGAYSPTGVLPDGRPLHTVAVEEKGYVEVEVSTCGQAQHASIPQPDSAPIRLVQALTRILARRPAIRITAATARLCACLAEGATGPHRYLLRHPGLLRRFGAHAARLNPMVTAMFSEARALTMISSGYKSNVVPADARAVLGVRILPGTAPEDVLDQLRRAAADPHVRITLVAHKPATRSPMDTSDFRVLARHAAGSAGSAPVTPILSPGASDARFWRLAGVTSYGWVPFVLPIGDIHGVHGANERLGIDSFQDGLRRYYQVVAALATR